MGGSNDAGSVGGTANPDSTAGSAETGGNGGLGGSSNEAGGSGGSGAAGDSGSGGSGSGQQDLSNTGLCAFAGTGVWQDGSYSGTHDLILVGDQGVGEDLCVVRFEANGVAEPEVPCTVISSGTQEACSFGTVVELSNPTTVADVDGVCGNSERALGEEGIVARVGERFGMGFARESTGHGNILVRFDDATMQWNEWASATFEADTGELEYRQSDGVCRY
jgi:hypothetical protein